MNADGSSTLSVTDKFMQDEDMKMGEDMAYLRDHPLVTRNNTKITRIDIPM